MRGGFHHEPEETAVHITIRDIRHAGVRSTIDNVPPRGNVFARSGIDGKSLMLAIVLGAIAGGLLGCIP